MARPFYRGGTSLKPRLIDVELDPSTGLVLPRRGISVSDRPDGLGHFGGANQVATLPPNLKIIKRGRAPHHIRGRSGPADVLPGVRRRLATDRSAPPVTGPSGGNPKCRARPHKHPP